jgi:predicted nucleic acid-binding protein
VIVVADSAPLHYLILLDLADLLPKLYGEVLIPSAVVSELSSGGTPAKVRGWLTAAPGWLRIEPVGSEYSSRVSDALGTREREAIALAQILHADLLLIDDSDGRFEARRLGLRVTGTLGVLRVAAELGLIDVNAVVRSLRATNFYVDDNLIRLVLESGWAEEAALTEGVGGGGVSLSRREPDSSFYLLPANTITGELRAPIRSFGRPALLTQGCPLHCACGEVQSSGARPRS